MRIPYYPTDAARAAIAADYDNCYKLPSEPAVAACDYQADGLTVTAAGGGSTYWIYSLDEAREAGVCREEGETFKHGRRVFIIVLA